MKLKYVLRDIGGSPCVFFGDTLIEHSDLGRNYGELLSAGFCSFEVQNGEITKVYVWGKSVSLGVESKPEDAEIIQRAMNRDY